jgi:hypothetical protein
VVVNGQTFVIEYVEGGVLIDGEFVSWEALEAEFAGDDFDDAFAACSFLDFEVE